MSVVIRTLRDSDRVKVQLKCEDPSLAVQSSKEDTDIKNIVKKYLRTGVLPQIQTNYADVSKITDLKVSLENVIAAKAAFENLPAEIRRRFDNDPVKLVEFAADAKNTDEAIALGLAIARPKKSSDAPPASKTPAKEAAKKDADKS